MTYKGHPLYYFLEDKTRSGSIKGQGSDAFGADWWLVSPSGAAITKSGDVATATGGSQLVGEQPVDREGHGPDLLTPGALDRH